MDKLTGRPPILDDNITMPIGDMAVWDDSGLPPMATDKQVEAIRQQRYYLNTISDLRSALSAAKFERDIWWPLAFCIGVLFGLVVGHVWF